MRWMAIIAHFVIGYGLGVGLFWIIWAIDQERREWPHRISLIRAFNLLVISTAIVINALN